MFRPGRALLRADTIGVEAMSKPRPLSRMQRSAFPVSVRYGAHPPRMWQREFRSTVTRRDEDRSTTASVPMNGDRTAIGQIEPRLAITFTCAVTDCGHRSTHEFSKRSYTKGIVIIQCPGCKNRHLIADNLSWFTENAGQPRNIEELIAEKGGKLKRGTVYSDGLDGETLEIEDTVEEVGDKTTQFV